MTRNDNGGEEDPIKMWEGTLKHKTMRGAQITWKVGVRVMTT